MPTKTWVVGEEVLAADFNTMIQRQVVAVFANAAARTAAIAAPIPGMVSYLTDTGRLEQYSDKAGVAGWYPPWSTAWGDVFYADVGLAATTGPAFITGTMFTFPVLNRRYLVQFRAQGTKDGTAGVSRFQFQTNRGAGVLAEQTQPAADTWAASLHERYIATAATDTQVQVNVQTTAGTIITTWGRLVVTDIGPA